MLLIYLLLAGAFALGWIMRGWIALRDVDELMRLEARVLDLEAGKILQAPSTPAEDWARRQGLLP